MALIPLIFKNNDTENIKTKIGKVSSKLARMIYSHNLTGKVGILKSYGNECNISNQVVGSLGKTTITFDKGALSVYGGIVYIEQGTTLEIPNVSNGSIGVYVDLTQQAGNEVSFYAGNDVPTDKDNLQNNENSGKYYFELYTYTVSGTSFTILSKTDLFIKPQSEITESLERILDSTNAVPRASRLDAVSQTENSVSFYIDNNLIRMEW